MIVNISLYIIIINGIKVRNYVFECKHVKVYTISYSKFLQRKSLLNKDFIRRRRKNKMQCLTG